MVALLLTHVSTGDQYRHGAVPCLNAPCVTRPVQPTQQMKFERKAPAKRDV